MSKPTVLCYQIFFRDTKHNFRAKAIDSEVGEDIVKKKHIIMAKVYLKHTTRLRTQVTGVNNIITTKLDALHDQSSFCLTL